MNLSDPAENTPSLRLFLMGGFRAEVSGRVVPEDVWRRASARALVKLLAVEPSHRLHREQIFDALWPDLAPDSAANGFRKALHHARRALEPEEQGSSGYLRVSSEVVALEVDRVWIDVDHFESLAEKALGSGEPAALREAAEAHGGELLPEDRYLDWVASHQERLADLRARLLLELAEALEAQSMHAEAIDRLQQVVQEDPAREDAHRSLMRLYALTGSRHQALRQYQTCRESLERELGVSPDPATEALHRQLVEVKALPPSAAPEGARVQLPRAIRRSSRIPLIGRAHVLDILTRHLAGAESGEGGLLLLLGGEAGVGKSRVAAELARQAHGRGDIVLWGASYEHEGQLPYGPFVEALDGYVAALSTDEQRWLASQYAELTRLLPSLARWARPGEAHSSPESERARLFAAVTGLLRELSGSRALLLVLDDLHAADTASLHLLHHLARIAPDHSWLFTATYREEEVEAGGLLQRIVAATMREEICQRVDLMRLAREDSHRLVQALLPDAPVEESTMDRLYGLSLGNPLFMQELARSMQEGGELRLADGRWSDETPVPQQVCDLLEARVHRMGEPVRRALTLAAVGGPDCTFSILRSAAGRLVPPLSEGDLLDALDRALDARILDERGELYVFRHPLFRAAMQERLSQPRRAQIHAVLAGAIEQERSEDVEALAFHFRAAADHVKAIDYVERAGDRAESLFANEAAEGYFRSLVALADDLRRPDQAARGREKLGAMLTRLARYDEALAALEAAVDLYRKADDREGEARSVARIGRVQFLRGAADEGIGRVEPLLRALEPSAGPSALAPLYAAYAPLLWMVDRFSEQLTAAERAAALGQEIGDAVIVAEAEQWRGYALLDLHRSEDGLAVLKQAAERAQGVGDLLILSRAWNGIATVYADRGDFATERTYLQWGLEVAERLGDPARIAFMASRRGMNSYLMGDWDEAAWYYERAMALFRDLGDFWAGARSLYALGRLDLQRGNVEAGVRRLEECIKEAERFVDTIGRRGADSLLAEHELLEGRSEAAWKRLQRLLQDLRITEEEADHLLPILAWAFLERGDLGRATELVERAIREAQAEPNLMELVDALIVRARILRRQREWAEAETVVQQALASTRSMPYPYGEGQILYIAGLLAQDMDNREEALRRFEAARAIFAELGALPDLRRAEQALGELVEA